MVDDQYETYTVEVLNSLKLNHEAWVERKLSNEELPLSEQKRDRIWGWSPDASELALLQFASSQTPLENYKAGIVHFIRREYESAVEAFSLAAEDHSLQAVSFNRAANCQRVLKRYREAISSYEASIRLAGTISDEADKRAMLVNSWHDIGWCTRRLAERLIGPNPQDAEWSGMQRKAQECFLRAAELDPTFSKAWFNAGQVCIDRGELEQAKVFSIRAFSTNTEYHRPAYNLAWIAAEQGDEQEAFRWLERTLQIDATQVYNAEDNESFKKLTDQPRLNELFREAKESVAVSSRRIK